MSDLGNSKLKTLSTPLQNHESGDSKDPAFQSKQIAVDFTSFKVHNDRITAILFNPEDQRLITGSSAGELCVFDQNGVISSRKTDFRGEITQLIIVERTDAFFANSYTSKSRDNKSTNERVFSAFGKIIDERAYEKNETVLLTPRVKKIKKEKQKKIGIAEFFNAFADHSTADHSTLQSHEDSDIHEELEKLRKELERERKINSRLLSVCTELEQFKPE